MNTPFYSVIIPVYNVEKYIQRCLDSVLSQSFLDFEVIIVDDESPDNSIAIINNNFNDKRIKILSKKNGGLSDARNFGLEHAKGKYVWFIDSDDYITEIDALQKIYKSILANEKPEIVVFNTKVIFENITREDIVIYNTSLDPETFSGFDYIKIYDVFPFNAWTQCYYKDFLTNNNFKFTKNLYYEDIYLNLDVYKKAKKVVGINEVLYTYFRRENSITSMAINENHLLSQMKVFKKVYDFYIQKDTPKKYFRERLLIEYDRTKTHYNKKFSGINYNILRDIKIPSENYESISKKLEKVLFSYFPLFILKNQVLFRKMNSLENRLFKK